MSKLSFASRWVRASALDFWTLPSGTLRLLSRNDHDLRVVRFRAVVLTLRLSALVYADGLFWKPPIGHTAPLMLRGVLYCVGWR